MKFNFDAFLGHHTLFYGETNKKKTFFTAKFVQFLIEAKEVEPKEITILDFAPNLNYINDVKIGGKIGDYFGQSIICHNITFEGEIIPPRLNARNREELYEIANKNFKKTSKILNSYNENPSSILILNDLSLYLHLGNERYLLDVIKKSDTFFGNSYYGASINKDFTKVFSINEKSKVEFIIENMENSFLIE